MGKYHRRCIIFFYLLISIAVFFPQFKYEYDCAVEPAVQQSPHLLQSVYKTSGHTCTHTDRQPAAVTRSPEGRPVTRHGPPVPVRVAAAPSSPVCNAPHALHLGRRHSAGANQPAIGTASDPRPSRWPRSPRRRSAAVESGELRWELTPLLATPRQWRTSYGDHARRGDRRAPQSIVAQ